MQQLFQDGRFLSILSVAITLLLLPGCGPATPPVRPTSTALTTPTAVPQDTVDPQPTIIATSPVPPAIDTPEPATPTPLPTATSEPQIYEVRVGDSLTHIAARFDTTSAAIQIANELFDAGAIFVGQKLLIPLASTTPSANEIATSADRGVTHNRFLCPAEIEPAPEGASLVGRSAVCRLPIVSYRLGQGETPLILVGGIHGGYEWNTILLAEEMHDHLQANPDLIPPSLSIYLIPNANPDGLYAVTGSSASFDPPQNFEETKLGRFNGRYVDLNRNWDCAWQPDALWGNEPVSGGSAPFSEPETRALRDYILQIDPAAVLFWHSAAVGVYPSGCPKIDPASVALANVFGRAAGYQSHDEFEHYDISGDAGNWLASQGIPAITVELSTHGALDLQENLAGLQALLRHIPSAALNHRR